MLPGFRGHLLSEFFLESRLTWPTGVPAADASGAGRARRSFVAWRRRCCTLGPSASVRALLESGAAPLIEALGFEPPSNAEVVGSAVITASVRCGAAHPLSLL